MTAIREQTTSPVATPVPKDSSNSPSVEINQKNRFVFLVKQLSL